MYMTRFPTESLIKQLQHGLLINLPLLAQLLEYPIFLGFLSLNQGLSIVYTVYSLVNVSHIEIII